jgi:hypothetical protein
MSPPVAGQQASVTVPLLLLAAAAVVHFNLKRERQRGGL